MAKLLKNNMHWSRHFSPHASATAHRTAQQFIGEQQDSFAWIFLSLNGAFRFPCFRAPRICTISDVFSHKFLINYVRSQTELFLTTNIWVLLLIPSMCANYHVCIGAKCRDLDPFFIVCELIAV